MTLGVHNRHENYISIVNHRDGLKCDVCDRLHGDAYFCRICYFTVHKKCAFVFILAEISNHPSHMGHSIHLYIYGDDNTDSKCHLCGKNTKRLLYHCHHCKLDLDIDCAMDGLSAKSNLKLPWHPHPLIMDSFGELMKCEVCGGANEHSYFCFRCKMIVHTRCASEISSPEITHPCHAKHSLKLLTEGAPDYTDPKCHLCGEETRKFIYHCDICKFNVNSVCVVDPPPIALSNLKVHEHTLTLLPRLVSFDCDACGMKGDRAPYMCLQCEFMIHQKCAHLPRVIHVNHHDHRVSYKYPLGLGEWRCGVCWEDIDWSYGAYSCSICPRYAIHSRCATRSDVWDGEELDGVLEEVEDIEPFKRNDDNTITYFNHPHNLRLKNNGEESIVCELCARPIGTYTFYNCSKSYCKFNIHETCAKLLKKKRHFLSPKPLYLVQRIAYGTDKCHACGQTCCKGFMYSSDMSKFFDLMCCSIDVPFIHESHPHPLLYLTLQHGEFKTCQSCGIDHAGTVLGCVKCNYFLDFRCATLPLTVNLPRYDDHPLSLCYGEKASGKYWCDICESETNPTDWFYTCKDCGVTLHSLCVSGDIRYAKPGGKILDHIELILNNTSSRPLCKNCCCRCPGTFILKIRDEDVFYCSFYCLHRSGRRIYNGGNSTLRPLWALG